MLKNVIKRCKYPEKSIQSHLGIINLSKVFLNRFILDMILPTTQQSLLFTQSSNSKYCH